VKRFQWRLQRVLDITERREQVVRGELFALAGAITRVRQEIIRRQVLLRTVLAELAKKSLAERLAQQILFLQQSVAVTREIDRLKAELAGLEAERSEKTAVFMKLRGQRQTLERLRTEARERHRREEDKREQAQFDETAHIAFARKQRSCSLSP
jgi:flagellar export protein FliJ